MDIEQRSEEWFKARLGKATGSGFKNILTELKSGSGEAAARRNYRAQLVVERFTGQQAERFKTSAMEWGTETEDLARFTYTVKTGNQVDEAGFIEHPTLAAGISPDGLVGEDGGIEIKCLNTANHIEVLKTGRVPREHMPQIQGCMWVTGRQWWDFVSFEPTLPENAQIFILRVPRDEVYIKNLRTEVAIFLDEVDADIAFLQQYGATQAPVTVPATKLTEKRLFD